MNRAHSTHYSEFPDPTIRHVLRGWNPAGGAARHDLQVGDVRIRNLSTNIRDWGGRTQFDGNSIFVFEAAELCVAHLGHLHHTLTPEQLKALGRIDVLLVPVDGGYTLDTDGMIEVLRDINAQLHAADALLQPVDAQPLPRQGASALPGGVRAQRLDQRFARDAPEDVQRPGSAGTLSVQAGGAPAVHNLCKPVDN